jgi:hypothetical protein
MRYIIHSWRIVLDHHSIFYTSQLQEKDQAVLPSLSELLNRSGSDKYWRHRYDHYYVRWFEPYRRLADLSMLEIGVQKARSLAFWNEYFLYPKRILGLAYGPDSTGVEEAVAGSLSSNSKVQVIRGDQSKVETMDVLKQMGPYDIIVDDGSHVPSHMIFTLFHLWQSVRPGGLYLIEDLETNYWKEGSVLYGYTFQGTGFGKPAQTNAIEKVKQLVDILARNQIGATTQDEGLSIMPGDDQLCSIEFGKNVLALRKCSEYEMEHQPRVQAKVYDEKLLKDWLVKAKASNPIGFKI